MSKGSSSKRKSQVLKDFDETLYTIIRPLPKEHLMAIETFRKADNNTSMKRDASMKQSSLKQKTADNDTSMKRDASRKQSSLKRKSLKNSQSVIRSDCIMKIPPENKMKNKSTSKPLQKFFPSFKNTNVPFSRTRLNALPYHLQIEIEGRKHVTVEATEFNTIKIIKEELCKQEKFEMESIALFFNDNRLEGSKTLYSYGIVSNSRIQLRLCKKIRVTGDFESQKIPLDIYTSVTVAKLKNLFSEKLAIDPISVELKYKGETLDYDKELFTYNVLNDSEINIALEEPIEGDVMSEGYKTVKAFFEMTDNLTKCRCSELRINAMAELFIIPLQTSLSRPNEKIKELSEFLQDFSESYHHKTCFKMKVSPKDTTIQGDHSSMGTTSFSGSESSLKSVVHAENSRVERFERIKIDNEFLKLCAEAEDFQIYKHLLKYKIGTICNLRSVSLLFRYSKEIVRYIGWDGKEKNPDVDKIIFFTKLYFKKYFQKDVIEKGGLDALTLSETYLD